MRAEVRRPKLHQTFEGEDLDCVAMLGTILLGDRIHIILTWKEV